MGKRNPLSAFALAAGLALAPMSGGAQSFDAESGEQDAYVQGNLLFLMYHEAGHLILDQLMNVDQGQDRLAAEEAADDVATWLILPDPDEPEQDEEIWAAMEGWLRSANAQEEPSQSPHYPDDAERASRIACYLYGSNPDLYPELAEAFSVAINSVNCGEEFEALHADIEDWFGDQLIPPASPDGGAIRVRYEAAGGNLEAARAYLMETRLLEDAAEDISQFIRLPQDVTLVARSCGAGAAEFRYSATRREITACYEAVDWFMRDANDEVQERAVAASSVSDGDDMGSGGARVTRRPRPRGGR
jgi:hypothetical protein